MKGPGPSKDGPGPFAYPRTSSTPPARPRSGRPPATTKPNLEAAAPNRATRCQPQEPRNPNLKPLGCRSPRVGSSRGAFASPVSEDAPRRSPTRPASEPSCGPVVFRQVNANGSPCRTLRGTPGFTSLKARVMFSLPAGERNSREGRSGSRRRPATNSTEFWRGPEAELQVSLRLTGVLIVCDTG